MSWTCDCPRQWPNNIPVCTVCMTDRPAKDAPSAPRYRCAACNESVRTVQLTRGEDGQERCASCHVAYLARRAAADPIAPEDLARCRARLDEAFRRADVMWASHRDPAPDRNSEGRALSVAGLTASPSLLERTGVHVLRYRAAVWCRTHPAEARALPGWNPKILDRLINPEAAPPSS